MDILEEVQWRAVRFIKGAGASDMKGEAARAAAIYLQEENAWGCLVSMYKYLMEKSEEDRVSGHNLKYKIFHLHWRKTPQVGAWSNTATGYPEWFWTLCLWRYSLKTQLDMAQSNLLWLTKFWSGAGLGGCLKMPSSLIFSVILCCVQADKPQEKPIGRNVRLLLTVLCSLLSG